jgi:hypothetical protein
MDGRAGHTLKCFLGDDGQSYSHVSAGAPADPGGGSIVLECLALSHLSLSTRSTVLQGLRSDSVSTAPELKYPAITLSFVSFSQIADEVHCCGVVEPLGNRSTAAAARQQQQHGSSKAAAAAAAAQTVAPLGNRSTAAVQQQHKRWSHSATVLGGLCTQHSMVGACEQRSAHVVGACEQRAAALL